MPNVLDNPPQPVPEPLFTLEFGANGGSIAPSTLEALRSWIQKEVSFWSWLPSHSSGPHREVIEQGVRQLGNALSQVNDACQYEQSNASAFTERLMQAKSSLSVAYQNHKLPHSSSKLGKRIDEIRKAHPLRAIAYAFTQLPNPNGYQFDARDFESWAGFIEGLAERTKITDVPKSALRAASESVEELRSKLETLISRRQEELDELHRTYDGLAQSLVTKDMARADSWDKFVETAEGKHREILADHESRMSDIESLFREKMALRGPVEYWSNREEHHGKYSRGFGIISFSLILLGGIAMTFWTVEVFGSVPQNGVPKTWQVASLVVMAVFLTWAIRLLIRLFLSHSHLRTDAAERVVMTQTYLALLEENKLSEEKDRSLILSALFRPASDGMVKEENIPHPMLDAITRLSGK
ncbi:MAG: DUF6161 domain-containing protein [Telluria sp.]